MKTAPAKKLFTSLTLIIFSVAILVLNNSCRKVRDTVAVITKTSAGSSIIYTDVVPDTLTKALNSYKLDLDNDGTKDFNLIFSLYTYTRCTGGGEGCPIKGALNLRIATLDSNLVLDSLLPNGVSYQAKPLNLNSSIKATSKTWHAESSIILDKAGNSCCGNGYGSWGSLNYGTDKYIGLQLKKGDNVYNGWIRIVITTGYIGSSSFTIKDYAYNKIPNQSIIAGQIK